MSPEPLKIRTLCAFCNHKGEATPEATLAHLAQLFEDTAMLQALEMIHGPDRGRRIYVERGGTVHMTVEELEEAAGQ